MKPLLIAGNWKSNKTVHEAMAWIEEFRDLSVEIRENKTVIICPPFTALAPMKQEIEKLSLPITLGAQDVSPFPLGSYTGEVAASQLKELAEWVIIGHSERRKYLGETDALLARKAHEARDAGLKIIFCVPDEKTPVPDGVDAVAYEPVWAIGTGKAEDPKAANSIIEAIKRKFSIPIGIYGGSVTPENVATFVSQPAIDGVLPGGASLKADIFASLITHAHA